MPDPATQSSNLATPTQAVAPGPEGTSLWNIQTQSPEWVPLDQVKSKLSAGTYRTYAGSDVLVQSGVGAEGSYTPQAAATAVAGGATPTHTEPYRDVEARKKEFANQFDNAGDKALTVVDGLVSGLSGGLLEGIPGGGLSEIEREKRGEVNPGYKTLGELAALAATFVAPESALKYTPLGAANELFGTASKATKAALAAKGGETALAKIARTGVSEAVGGAVASGALSSAHAVSQAVQGKPVSGYAILDDVGLGAAIGAGFGTVGETLGLAAKKAADVKAQIQAAARFDESALPVRRVLTDVTTSWDTAHKLASQRVEALDKLVKSGMLDAEIPGTEWLAERSSAKVAADQARAKLDKIAGTTDPVAIGERLHDMAVSGKAKEAQKLYEAFDNYGTAVSKLDSAMQPTTFDNAHLHDVIGDLDLSIPSSEHPMQRLEQMIENGTPADEIQRFADQIDANYNGAKKEPTPGANNPTQDVQAGRRQNEQHNIDFGEVAHKVPEPEIVSSKGEPVGISVKNVEMPKGAQPEPPRKYVPGLNVPDEEKAMSILSGGSRAGNEEAGFKAKRILYEASQVSAPVRPTNLGNNIQGLLDQLTAATGNRLGSEEARALAVKLGMNPSALTGPVSKRLADLWSLHRMSEALAENMETSGSGPKSKLATALGWGVVSGARHIGYEAGGAATAGVVGSLARQALGTALHGAAALSAVAGRFRQSAVNGLAKALNPTGRRALTMTGIYKTVSASYKPDEPPTTDFNTKADQLRWLLQNPEPTTNHLKQVFKSIGAVDPVAYTATIAAAQKRLTNLAKALPTAGTSSLMVKHSGPTASQIAEWHSYEAVTADRELVFKYLKAGMMPEGVVSAMNEQHPDYINEIKEYVLNNPDEVKSSSHATKMALSRLLGVPLVPEANPAYVSRMQEPYQKAKQEAAQRAQGPATLHAPQPTPVQIIQLPR